MVPDAIRKGTDKAKKAMGPVSNFRRYHPLPYFRTYDGGKVLLRPARPGTGIIVAVAFALSLRLLGSKACPSHLDPTTSSRSLLL